jgi:predicted metal-dependent hydrolase
MPAVQTAFEFGPARPAPWLLVQRDPDAERLRLERKLEQRLGELLGKEVALSFNDNTRTMLSARARGQITHVRLHHMFIDADEPTISAVARYLVDGHTIASGHLRHFIAQHDDRIRRKRRNVTVQGRGHHHDLGTIAAELNERYFEGQVSVRIGWARMSKRSGRGRKRRSIKLGSYLSRGAVVRVHPVLDAPWVPDYFVHYIVYHELLHHVIDMPVQNGRRRLHGPDFRERERAFDRYAEAIAWEQANLDRLLSG